MNGFADAINAAMRQQQEELRYYGRFLAQARIALSELEPMPLEDRRLVREGYAQQLADYPNG
jgi:hypothetical protein